MASLRQRKPVGSFVIRCGVCSAAKKSGVDRPMHVVWMETRMSIGLDDIVGEVMTAWPATIRVFLDFRMGCVGCPISSFHSVEEACREHGIDHDTFMAALRVAAAAVMA
jgi:hybrid cluster-associated redox disulfide protein